jgi:hypothetical protein
MKVLAKAGAFATIAVVIAAFAQQARASGAYGYYTSSQVYCHDVANSVYIEARFARNSGFSSQWIAYTHKVVNLDTGKEIQLAANNNTNWFMFNHTQPFGGLQWASVTSGAPVAHTWYTIPEGKYDVYTAYAWYDGYWVYTGWIKASSVSYGGMSYCLV